MEYDHREYINHAGIAHLFNAEARCTLCTWVMSLESTTALAHLDNIEEVEHQATLHLENHPPRKD